jgi:hypothetical protein
MRSASRCAARCEARLGPWRRCPQKSAPRRAPRLRTPRRRARRLETATSDAQRGASLASLTTSTLPRKNTSAEDHADLGGRRALGELGQPLCSPRRRAWQASASGHASQRGGAASTRSRRAPSTPGCNHRRAPRARAPCGSDWMRFFSGARAGSPRSANSRHSTRTTLPSTPAPRAESDAGDRSRPCRVRRQTARAAPRTRSAPRRRVRSRPIAPRGAGCAPRVVAEPLPGVEHVVLAGPRQRRHVGKRCMKRVKYGRTVLTCVCCSMHLAHPDGVRVAVRRKGRSRRTLSYQPSRGRTMSDRWVPPLSIRRNRRKSPPSGRGALHPLAKTGAVAGKSGPLAYRLPGGGFSLWRLGKV